MSRQCVTLLALSAAFLMLAPGGAGAADAFHFGASKLTAAQIDAYLATKKLKKPKRTSPLAGHAGSLLRHGQRFDIDPRLIAAIAGQESSFGMRLCAAHNAWNWFWGGSCKRSPFVSYDRGIEVVSKYMRRSYLNKGYTTIPLIRRKYCIDGCEHWTGGVTFFYKELAALGPAPTPKPAPTPNPADEPIRNDPDWLDRPWLLGAALAALLFALLGGTGYAAYRLGRKRAGA